MIERLISPRFKALASQFPAVVITGPRQSGKTTLAKSLFPKKPYINLERPDELDRFRADPIGSFKAYLESGAILDEIQRMPELTSWLQTYIDQSPEPGRWILTGSNQPLLRQNVSQSLAGRAAYLQLWPFSARELADDRKYLELDTDGRIQTGYFPPLYDRWFLPSDWQEQYIATYLERDLSTLLQVRNLTQFRRFLALCAGRTGQILNLSDLARDADISHTTAREWLSILESGFIVFLVRPFHTNFGKRLTKSPKLYFSDPGLACRLLGIRESAQLAQHPLRGALFESMVVADYMKESDALGDGAQFYFWNAPGGGEVDLVIEKGSALEGVEIKSGATFRPDMLRNLRRWAEVVNVPSGNLTLVYDGDQTMESGGARIIPWRSRELR